MRLAAPITFLSWAVLVQPVLGDDDNDRRHKYGEGRNKDGAAYVGDQKTKEQLTPNMMNHYAQSKMHFAMGNIPMGVMEQTKGDLLKQQIQENKRTADKNRESEKLVSKEPDAKPTTLQAMETRVNTIDKDRQSAKAQAAAPGSSLSMPNDPATPPANTLPAPAAAPEAKASGTEQLAEMASSPATPVGMSTELDGKAPSETAASEPEARSVASAIETPPAADTAPAAPSWKQDLEGLSKQGGDTSPAGLLGQSTLVSSPTLPQQRLLGALSGDSKRSKEDDLFASVGKEEPRKGRAAADSRRSRRGGRSGRASDRVLADRPPLYEE